MVHNVLPLGYGGGGNGLSFLVAILPYVENQPLYDSVNMNAGASWTVQSTSLSTYLCPSDGLARIESYGGATNYAGNQGSGFQSFEYNGAFSHSNPVRFADITDGTSDTVAVSEWLTTRDTGFTRDSDRSVFHTSQRYLQKNELNKFIQLCESVDPKSAQIAPMMIGVRWTHGDFGHSLYNHVMPIQKSHCTNGGNHQEGAWTAKSRHPGGVNSVMADGHVVFFRSSIAPSVWSGFGSRNGGEIVTVDTN